MNAGDKVEKEIFDMAASPSLHPIVRKKERLSKEI